MKKVTLRGSVFLRTFIRLLTHTQMLPILESGEETLVGGQAVMEGVMMRAPHSYCVAVRKPMAKSSPSRGRCRACPRSIRSSSCPILRGLGTLGQAMTLGVKALQVFRRRPLSTSRRIQPEKRPPKKYANGRWLIAAICVFAALFSVHVQVRAAVPGHQAWQSCPRAARAHRVQHDGRRDPHGDLPRFPVTAFRG